MKIVRLQAENVKRLVAAEVTPQGDVIIVGGRNGQGKTSLLDSIAMALGGKDLVPDQPLRQGAKAGHVEVDLGEIQVRRTFTAGGGGSLVVSNKQGAVFRSPQSILDALVGRLTFDPLAFARMDGRKQLETLRALVKLDLSDLEAKREELYTQRTDVNRSVKNLEGALANMPEHRDVGEPVSIAAIADELAAAEATKLEVEEAARRVNTREQFALKLKAQKAEIAARLRALDEQLERVQADLGEAELAIAGAQSDLEAKRAAAIDPKPIRDRLAGAEAVNRKVRENAERRSARESIVETKDLANKLTDQITELDVAKAKRLAEQQFPVEGLAFSDDAVLFNGIPFAQASGAEQLRVSVAMAAAMNPKLRVALIRDGSLLDADSLRQVAECAAAHDLQLWLERVSEDGAGCSVVIEDGTVRAPAAAEVPA